LRRERAHAGERREVGAERLHLGRAAALAHGALGLRETLLVAADEQHAHPGARQRHGALEADAARGAGDERRPAAHEPRGGRAVAVGRRDAHVIALLSKLRSPAHDSAAVSRRSTEPAMRSGMCGTLGVIAPRSPSATKVSGLTSTAHFTIGEW